MELYYTPACLIRQKKPKLQLIFLQTLSGRTDQRKRLDVVPAAEFSGFVTEQFEVRMDHGAAQLCWDILLLKV
jgi:hypothetical protein